MSIDRTDTLTEGQRRHLVASLANVSAALGEIETIARRTSPTRRESPAGVVDDDLPLGFESAIQRPITRARAELAALVDALHLQAPDTSASRSILALVMSSLVILEAAGIANLGGYGEIHPSLPALLEPALSRIHEQVRAIGDAVAAGAKRLLTEESPR